MGISLSVTHSSLFLVFGEGHDIHVLAGKHKFIMKHRINSNFYPFQSLGMAIVLSSFQIGLTIGPAIGGYHLLLSVLFTVFALH